MLVLFRLACLHQSQEYHFAIVQVKVFACRYVNTNNAVKFGKKCFLDHHWRPVDLTLVKVDLGFVLKVL